MEGRHGKTLGEGIDDWRIRQDALDDLEADFLEWALKVPEPKGNLDWDRFPFQPEMYRALGWKREGVVKKGTQIGASAFLSRWAMFGADTRGITALYVFPTKTHVNDYADARIKPLIRKSAYLKAKVPFGYVDNKGLKQIGSGFVYFRGSQSKVALDSVDADWLALDEYDTLVQENIPDAERRIGGSLNGLIRRIGVPSVHNFGIAKRFEESDAREWMVKCPHCGEWQEIRFYENIEWTEELPSGVVRMRADEQAALAEPTIGIVHEVFRVCSKCRKAIDDAIGGGEWVAKHPQRPIPGFHPTRLIVPRANLKEIVEASKQTEPYRVQVFWNKDLGEPYSSDENRLSLAALMAAQRDFRMVEGAVQNDHYRTMGIDVASKRALNVRISEHTDERMKKALWIGTCRSFNDLPKLMERYHVNMACIDHMPEYRLARSFAAMFPGRVYLVNYTGPATKKVLKIDFDSWQVTARRTEAIDATLEQVRTQRNLLPLDWPESYPAHMQAMYRRVLVDPDTETVTVDYVSTGPDDYCHAEVFDMLATEVYWAVQAVTEEMRDTFTPLESMLEFERSRLSIPEDYEYRPGFGDDEPEYSPGFE